ncbi:tetratricopeptide repeat protein [Paucidesulfovibrio longus]|uniref:tetratricopeptide repeat protein n=1 Tax=Paucidesulfovibrio longus TaxID=889 RepID=UPI0003B42509|nr:tetratricopeptide repeat protein [Paucidesulfovibrio longus]
MRPLTLVLALVWMLLQPVSSLAASITFRTRADTDVLTFDLAAAPVPGAVSRTGPQALNVRLPEGDGLAVGQTFQAARLVDSVEPSPEGALIKLKTNAFGYIFTPVPGKNALQIQIFRDPTGARWKDPTAAALPPDVPNPLPPQPDLRAPAAPAAPAPAAAGNGAQQPAGAPPAGEGNLTLDRPQPALNSLFSVPYAVRVPVSGLNNELQVRPSEIGTVNVETGTARYKAVNTISEPTAPERVLPATDTEIPSPGRTVSGAPPGGTDGQASWLRRQTALFAPPAPSAPAAPAAPAAAAPAPPDAPSQAPSSSLAAQAQQAMQQAQAVYDGKAPADAPPSPVPTDAASAPEPAPAQTGVKVQDTAVQGAIDTIESQQAQAAAQAGVPASGAGLTPEEAKRIENLQLSLIKAQSHIATGKLAEAKNELESLLAQPDVPAKMRLEATYSLGGVLMTLYKDSAAEHFDEINSLYKEAMNADLRSPELPQALLNLGLLNLRVGNLPEAQAYFDLLKSKYPDDQNVPAIDYYWGEYYFRQGDWQEAADRFQGFIERYPEQERLARQAAFRLAEALKNLGLYDQAYQIVDYIDKRWPQVFESSPGFLKLAGDIEYHLGKYDQAKSHYWTYYNINPKAEAADIALARIGDVFLQQGDAQAARSIYERTVQDYPDLEGGLVAKMRLAEEGIHDSPTMVEMVTVFDRPFTLRPKQVYTEIVDQHPESPLAPLALLKLGMWHFYQKEYPDALAAAQRLLDEYPRSPLTDRARELGNRAFALAVPQLLDQEMYQAVVDYWEKYHFINDSSDDESNATRIGVARSYAALNDYEKALDLLKPFLGDKQVPEYSEMALAVAADIFLKQKAWNRINDLSTHAEQNWDLSPRARRLLMHANAVALENLGETQKSARLWAQLGADENVEPFIRADSLYYMAKEAMKHEDLRRVFVYAQEALSLLLSSKGYPEKIKDCLLMSIYATERSGRYRQALKWALEYDKYVPEDDPEWASQRYKLAELYRKSGFPDEWARVMGDLRDKQPDSLYGRLAATALETDKLEQRAQEYAPVPN